MSITYIIYPVPEARPKIVGSKVSSQVTVNPADLSVSGFIEKLVRVAPGAQPSAFQAVSSSPFRVTLTRQQFDAFMTTVINALPSGTIPSGSDVVVYTGSIGPI